MKKIIVIISVFLCFSVVAQKDKRFKPGVEIIQVEKKSNYQVPKSILIEFTGHTHSITYYKDLAKKLQKRFKRKSIKVDFNYSLSAENPFESDLKKIPKRKLKKEGFESTLQITILPSKTPKDWLNYKDINYRKTQYILVVKLDDKLTKEIIKITLNTHAYYTILTQNKKVSNTIVKILTEKN
ncbi:hypothetical protein [Polaribacter uvawellassae]|uniref:hypothetical protein n=1 Tax=Polaribacter uvawellassae TaxID=3133495 RepID=UPI00321B6BC2